MGYLGNFIVYTLAMVGVIVVALLVVKNSTSFGSGAKSKYLKVVDSMSLGPRKTLYIVSTGREKFLIAGDSDRTSLISKLDSSEEVKLQENGFKMENTLEKPQSSSFHQTISHLAKASYMDKGLGINSSMLHKDNGKNNSSVIKNMLENLK